MKKTIALILTLTLALLALASCSPKQSKITIGYLNGPTGMGMAKLIADTPEDSEKYVFESYSDKPGNAISDLESGAIDMACLPTNSAANLFNKGDDISVIAVNTLGSLFIIADKSTNIETINDLAGKTIYASVPGSTTEPILKHILSENNVQADIEVDSTTHQDLVKKVKDSGGTAIAILPEPMVSNALLQANNYEVKLNISEEWSKVSDQPLAMGCIVVRNDFLKENKASVDAFLKDYKASVDFIAAKENRATAAQTIVNVGIIPKLPLASSAMNNLDGSIVLITGQEMTQTLKAFYAVLLESSSASVGGKQPSDAFYYD
ncbi:MAG: ABC transporter substrate-binding protein [Clostridia bacterium]|nr:ABC transporter substrate-binding protein [Clostridia bacterium]